MSCIHKFYDYELHQNGEFGLLPNWKAKTLIIETFNSCNIFHSQNTAIYFYGLIFCKAIIAADGTIISSFKKN